MKQLLFLPILLLSLLFASPLTGTSSPPGDQIVYVDAGDNLSPIQACEIAVISGQEICIRNVIATTDQIYLVAEVSITGILLNEGYKITLPIQRCYQGSYFDPSGIINISSHTNQKYFLRLRRLAT